MQSGDSRCGVGASICLSSSPKLPTSEPSTTSCLFLREVLVTVVHHASSAMAATPVKNKGKKKQEGCAR